MVSTRRPCHRCGKAKCNKIFRIPVGKPVKAIYRICGRCIVLNAKSTRQWLDEQEEKLE